MASAVLWFLQLCVGWFVGKLTVEALACGYYSRHPETIQYNKDTKTEMRESYNGRIKFSI